MPPASLLPSLCIVSHNAYGAISGGRAGHIGGVEWQTSLTARWLAAHGWRISMLTWDEGGPAEENFDGVRVIKICRQLAGLPGLRFFHPKWTGLIRAMRRANADVYYQNGGECVTGQVALWWGRNDRAFVFSAASNADCDPRLPELKTYRERVLYRAGIRRADCVVAQTLTQQRNLQKHFGVAARCIPMPCPGPVASEPVARDLESNRILWIGRVCRVKRPDRLLELARSCPELQFDLVGPLYDDELSREVAHHAHQLPNLTVHGQMPRPQVAPFYRRAALLCCTSDYEGFPNTFLEAWSHGLPIVSLFDPDGLISSRRLGIAVRDPAELKPAIDSLLRSPLAYQEMSRNARTYYLENHSVERILPQFEQVFLDACRRAKVMAGFPDTEHRVASQTE